MKICIIGAGITGLTTGYKLSKLGHEVEIFESASFSGGQASTINFENFEIEKAYHHLFVTDKAILELYKELDLEDELEWYKSKVATFAEKKIWSTTSPIDLLKLPIIPLKDRINLALISLRLKLIKNWKKLESISAYQWLSKHVSDRTFEIIFEPLLRGKFGRYYKDICMPWFWAKIQTRVSSRNKKFDEILCYPKNSFSLLIKKLENEIQNQGGSIKHNHLITSINTQDNKVSSVNYISDNKSKHIENFDAVVSTAPYSILSRLITLDKSITEKMNKVQYMSAVVMILILKNPISNYYWLSIADKEFPFLGIIEHTNLLPKEKYNNNNIVYITNYVEEDNELLDMNYEEVIEKYTPFIKSINNTFSKNEIIDYKFNKINYAQPIIPINYSSYRIPIKLPVFGLYSANTAQIYPEDRGTNYSVDLGQKVTNIILEDENGFIKR
ncbi:MAG: NAD(P)/FAD-dependent oxidoreductase [SAR202 cluster bacterium]|nr:NAD(P)/FAD-dependent oxidoreductase [SAR202 cluster bacterium]RZP18311.1 MAG: NAD(P)/FAD-dependent oxidoreductase [Chloroflexota bacterium]|tara:strand:+ start:4635 stop:5963 length:1329 start_codon:yes stop_codon:yes gene_type:complete